jgi:alanyl-tRNA synthetase
VRLVEIAGLDLNTCGGTHLRSTAEIETLKLLSTESLRGGTRVFFAAGGRARRRLAEHEHRNAALRALLGVPDEALATAAQAKLEQLRAAEKRAGALEEDLAGSLGEALAAQPGLLAERHVEAKGAGFLQQCARAVIAQAPAKAVFLTATAEGQSFFVLAAGEMSSLDVAAAGKEIAALLGGRGGGAGRLFQGKAGNLEARVQALARLAQALHVELP